MQEKYRWLAGKLKKGEIVMEGHRKIKILLADDSITIRRVVEMTLPQDKFQITSVGDGEAALEVLASERPDVLLADVIMPEMDGYALCSVVRSSPQFNDIPVILLVGTFENYDEERGKNCGANDHIVKPFETSDLIEKIRKATQRAEEMPAPSNVVLTPAVEEAAGIVPEIAVQDAVAEEVAMERGDQVDFAERESVELEEGGVPQGVVEPFETLSEVPGHHEYCTDEVPCPEPAREEAVGQAFEEASLAAASSPREAEPDTGDESFPWEEDIDLPSSEESTPVVAESPATEGAAQAAVEEEHVFSLADLKPDVLEALEKGEELPEETVQVEEVVQAAETDETVETVSSPVTLSGDSMQALQESIEKAVRDAVLSAFGDFFRDAVEKVARGVVPGLVEKAIREELDKRGG